MESFIGEHLTYGLVTIKAEPWIAADTVSKTYQYLQTQLLHRKPRALSARNLRVSGFVLKELRRLAEGETELESRLSWRELMERYNQENEDEPYRYERQFNRDFYRAARFVVHPFEVSMVQARLDELNSKVLMPTEADRG